MKASDWGRLYRTIRHLRPRQIAARAYLGARHRLYAHFPQAARRGLEGPARVDPAGLERLREWMHLKHPTISAGWRELAAGAAEGRFTFLNQTARSGSQGPDWHPRDKAMLWQFHLHYADYVAALALGAARGDESAWAGRALGLIESWIAANPPGLRPGWDSYPLSLRVVNWAAALALLEERVDEAGRCGMAASLAAQGRFLARHLEWHLGGNHLVKNAKALLVLGTLFQGPEAAAWRTRGLSILLAEARRQVLADGGHYERSPLYQGIVLEDLLDASVLAKPAPGIRGDLADLERTAVRMIDWLALLRHPDGGLALFNDCVERGEPAPAEILAYASRVTGHEPPATGSMALPASGYYVIERGAGRALIDCGELGPDELPAHGHSDTLSFELSCEGRRVVVDAGVSEYEPGELRRYVRSTAAHNTVEVDGEEQSEVWGAFRVGRRARPGPARIETSSEQAGFAGSHDGYARLGIVHHRHLLAIDRAWIVIDELLGRGRHRFASRLHFHPAFRLEAAGAGWRVRDDRGEFQVRVLGPVSGAQETARYCPDWSIVFPSPLLAFRGAAEAPVAFGYVLAPAGDEVELALETDGRGVTLTGRLGGRSIRTRSDRCTSSS